MPGNISNRGWLIVALALIVIWFANLEVRKLVRPDEGRYAEIPREMAVTGDWVTPRLDGYKYFEKPALQYWTTAAAYDVLGEHHWTSRLWTALTGLLGVATVVFCGWRIFARETGIYAGLATASALLYAGMGHVNTLDMGVTCFMTITLCAFLLAQRNDAAPKESRNWMYLAWAAAGLAMLSKGLQSVVLPGAVFVLYTLIERDWGIWKKLHPVGGLAIFLVITVPWFVAVSLANPEFARFFFIHEHFERFLTKEHHRYQPWWYFIPILLAGAVPWTLMMFDGLAASWRAQPAVRFKPMRFLAIWSVFIFAFFSASGSKLPSYILPIIPALALLLGARLTQLSAKRFTWEAAAMLLVAAIVVGVAPFLTRFADDEVPPGLFAAFQPWLIAAGVVLAAGCVGAIVAVRRGNRDWAVLLLAVGGLGFAQLGLTGHDSFAPSQSSYYLVQQAKPELVREGLWEKPEVPFYSVGMYEQTLPFYIKRTVMLVAHEDELEFGIQREPAKYIPAVDEFARRWQSGGQALAIMQPGRYRELVKSGLPMRLIAQDTRRVIVVRQ